MGYISQDNEQVSKEYISAAERLKVKSGVMQSKRKMAGPFSICMKE